MSLLSQVTYTQATAGNRLFTVPFQYLSKLHISVTVDGTTASFDWLNDNTVELDVAPDVGAEVLIKRLTQRDELIVQFTDASTLTASALNVGNRQSLYVVQEAGDLSEIAEQIATEANATAGEADTKADAAVITANDALDVASALSDVDSGDILLGADNLNKVADVGAARTKLDVDSKAVGRDRANHTGTQTLATISDAGTAASAELTDFIGSQELLAAVAEAANVGEAISFVGKGAIVESDTNINGSYVRWESGEQVCWHDIISFSNEGSDFRPTWTYPAEFTQIPFAAGSAWRDNGGQGSSITTWSVDTSIDFTGSSVDLIIDGQTDDEISYTSYAWGFWK